MSGFFRMSGNRLNYISEPCTNTDIIKTCMYCGEVAYFSEGHDYCWISCLNSKCKGYINNTTGPYINSADSIKKWNKQNKKPDTRDYIHLIRQEAKQKTENRKRLIIALFIISFLSIVIPYLIKYLLWKMN